MKRTRRAKAAKPRYFSLVALHNQIDKAIERLKEESRSPARDKLLNDLKRCQAMLDCGETMSPNIA